MPRRNLNDLLAFVTVAREGSFTKAAGTLGVTQSALSQAIRGLEEGLQIRLLTRTTRSVAPTSAGERLMKAIGHRFDEIEAELEALTELRDKPAGTVRITCGDTCCTRCCCPSSCRCCASIRTSSWSST
jgi:DNA-binding transcriptional LysR family regulator